MTAFVVFAHHHRPTLPMPALLSPTSFISAGEALTTPSLRRLSEALPALYAETSLRELPRAFADTLVKLIPGESYGVVVHDHAERRRRWHLRPAAPEHESLVPGFFENFHEFRPADYRRLNKCGTALALSDFVSAPGMNDLAIYREYYRPLRMEDDLSINVQRGDVVICAAVLRRARGFRRDERELMNALRPHFKQAWANAQCFQHLSSAAESTTVPPQNWGPEPLEVQFGLTPREAEVLIWVAQGKTNPEVATILGIRPYTVRTHLERIFTKLGVGTRHAAGLRAIEVLGMPAPAAPAAPGFRV
jgi:DNA-binding CsgD family transcriptional regulator